MIVWDYHPAAILRKRLSPDSSGYPAEGFVLMACGGVAADSGLRKVR